MARLRDRLQTRAAARFVGCEAELAQIGEALAGDPPPSIYAPGVVARVLLGGRPGLTPARQPVPV